MRRRKRRRRTEDVIDNDDDNQADSVEEHGDNVDEEYDVAIDRDSGDDDGDDDDDDDAGEDAAAGDMVMVTMVRVLMATMPGHERRDCRDAYRW